MVSVLRHVAVLRGMLAPDEQEVRWIRAERQPQGQAGALLLSDRRLLFSGMGFISQAQESWPLAVVRGAEVRDGKPAVLGLRVVGLPEAFSGRVADLRALADLLGSEESEVAAGDLLGELERLTALRDAGALTGAEFEAAKRRLLA